MSTYVVVSTLQDSPAEWFLKLASQMGKFGSGNLILQRLGSGSDDGLLAAQDHGDQVGERFAGSGTGLGNQMAFILDGLGDGIEHVDLAVAAFATRWQRCGYMMQGFSCGVGQRHNP